MGDIGVIFLLILILAHVTSDFIVQGKSIVEKRTSNKLQERILYNLYHSVIVLGVTTFMLLLKSSFSWSMIIVSMIIFVTHFIVDAVKSEISNLKKPVLNFYVFFIDQIIHLSIIFFLWMNFNVKSDGVIRLIINLFHEDKVRSIVLNYNTLNYSTLAINIILFVIILIYVTFGGDVVIRSILSILRNTNSLVTKDISDTEENSEILADTKAQIAVTTEIDSKKQNNVFKTIEIKISNIKNYISKKINIKEQVKGNINLSLNEQSLDIKDPLYRRGKIIGVIERAIILVLAISSQFTAIGFVIAAKSIARTSKIEKDPDFAEEYLIGTLSSCLIAIIGGYIFNILKLIK